MALFNYATKEITLKTVYYGPGLSGKTTNLQYLHSILNPESTGKLLSLATDVDRTLFFDFLPVEIGKLRDFSIRFQLYTVPGQVRYNATRKLVLKGADAVCFVADSQAEMKDQNIESFENMMENLRDNNINPEDIPIVLQYNKRDLKNILSIDDLNRDLNPNGKYEYLEASAIDGTGVEDTYKLIIKLLLKHIEKKHRLDILKPAEAEEMRQAEPVDESRFEPVTEEPETLLPETAGEEAEVVSEYELDEGIDAVPVENYADELSEKSPVMQEASPPPETAPSESMEEGTEPVTEPSTDEDSDAAIMTENLYAGQEEPVSGDTDAFAQEEFTGKTYEEFLPPPVEEQISATDELKELQDAITSKYGELQQRQESKVEEPDEPVTDSEIREVPVIPTDKVDAIVRDLGEITTILTGMKDSFSTLNKNVLLLDKDIKNIKDVIEIKELKELKELKREQKETNAFLKHIMNVFDKLKIKKSWFKL